MTIQTANLTTIGAAASAVVEKLAKDRIPQHEDGIFFGLDESTYHSDTALGSTALKALAENPCEYWYASPYNPMREDEETPSQAFGTALHKCVLEGKEAFEATYAPYFHPGNTKPGKDERAAILAAGKRPIKASEWERIQMAGATVRANPHLADAFTNGLPEVSVFYTDDRGIRKKARIDFLKIRASVDVKTIANQNRMEFKRACVNAIATYRYDVQAAAYFDARQALRRLAREGRVFGDHDAEWLKRVVAVDEWATVLVFVQSQRSPLVWAGMISPGNGILDHSRAALRLAEDNYLAFMERFGPHTPWVIVEPIEEVTLEDMPGWFGRVA